MIQEQDLVSVPKGFLADWDVRPRLTVESAHTDLPPEELSAHQSAQTECFPGSLTLEPEGAPLGVDAET